MDIRQMKQVLAIGRQGSFSKAARDLGIAQPTLSKSIARLEDELGVKLFDRSTWRAQMTPMGAFLVQQAAALVEDAHRLDRNIQLISRGELGEIKIGLGPALRSNFMPRLAARILQNHPDLRLTIMAESSVELIRGVRSGAFDIIVLADTAISNEKNLVRFDVMEGAGVAVAAPGHPLAGQPNISVAEFSRHYVIGSAASSTAPPILYAMPELYQRKPGKEPFRPRVVTNDMETTIELVEQGLGLYAGPEHIVSAGLASGALVRLDVDWSFTYRAIAAMTTAASQSPMLRQVVRYAHDVATERLSVNK